MSSSSPRGGSASQEIGMTDDRPMVEVTGVTKRFGSFAAVDDVSLRIGANEFFALLGPSGCGKTTLLRMLAGFERASTGMILIDGEDMAPVQPNRRPVNMVFQRYAVFPHMTVRDNVAYGLKVTGTPRAEIGSRVDDALAMVRLDGYGARQPDQLSGGQQQRVALARALIKRPKVLLLDEPLSALDKKLREEMQLELVRLQHEVGITFIIVTHDQEEALSMADRIAVMDKGRILQTAPPDELYERPNCRMVADFIGTMNFFPVKVVDAGGERVRLEAAGLGTISLPGPAPDGGGLDLAVRPERVELLRAPPPDGAIVASGRIVQIAYFGDTSHVYLETDDGLRITCNQQNRGPASVAPAVGDRCHAVLDPAACILIAD
jgi:spermidine/putrescine ABC transporter ATP-binding subunit